MIWAILIYFLSAIPNAQLTFKNSPGVDKIIYAALYFVLCWLVWRSFYYQDTLPVVRNSAFLGAFIFCVVYGFLDEYHLSFLPGRDSDFYHVVADIGGALLFIAIAALTRGNRKEDKQGPES